MSDTTPTQESENARKAFEVLGQFLQEDGWYPQPLEGQCVYRMGYSGKNTQMTCFAQIQMELEQFLFYVIAPAKVPEERRPAVAEFITRANYGLRIGNFELDFRDGEVRYKSSLDFEGTALVPELIRNAIYPAAQTLDRYMPGLMGVVFGGKVPADAIAEIEGG